MSAVPSTTASPGKPLVQAHDLAKTFDVSAPGSTA